MVPRDADCFLAFAGLRDIVGGLHPYERVHFHPEGFLDAQRISPERSALPFSKLDNAGRETRSAAAAAVTERPAGWIISVRIKSPGCGGFFMGMALAPLRSSGSLPRSRRKSRSPSCRYGRSAAGCG